MKIVHFDNSTQFYKHIKSYLLQQEAAHNLLLGICSELMNQPSLNAHPPYLATVEADDTLLVVAIQTPPKPLFLSQAIHLNAVAEIAQDLNSRNVLLPGVMGADAEAVTFAETWTKLTGQSYRKRMALRIHQLESVQPISQANGYLRRATSNDRELLIQWYHSFTLEVGDDTDIQTIEQLVNYRLSEGNLYLWEDDIPVSVAGCGGKTLQGIRINLVYTPPEHRQKGYASSCVAGLSQILLNQGNRFCFLFTDLSNLTAIHIYPTIGYQPVCDTSIYSFDS